MSERGPPAPNIWQISKSYSNRGPGGGQIIPTYHYWYPRSDITVGLSSPQIDRFLSDVSYF